MNASYGALREASFGTLLTRSFENLWLIRGHVLGYLGGVAAFAFVLPLAGLGISGVGGLAVYLAGQYWLFRALLKARGLLESGRLHILAFFGLALLLILPILFGLGLFVLPGLYLVARWIAAPAFVAARGEGPVAAASASWRAVRGSTGAIVGAVCVFGVLVSLLGAAASLVDGALAGLDAYRTVRPANIVQINLMPLLLLGLSVAAYEALGPQDNTIEDVFG